MVGDSRVTESAVVGNSPLVVGDSPFVVGYSYMSAREPSVGEAASVM